MANNEAAIVPGELVCPLCDSDVSPRSTMCLSCHLPISDVVRNQEDAQRNARAGSRSWRRLRSGLFGLVVYAAVVAWCAAQLPTSLLFVGPAAVAGVWLHTVKGQRVLGLLAFTVVVVLVPLLLWPSMWTGLFADLTSR